MPTQQTIGLMARLKSMALAIVVLATAAGVGTDAHAGPVSFNVRQPASAATYVWAGTLHQNYNGMPVLDASHTSYRALRSGQSHGPRQITDCLGVLDDCACDVGNRTLPGVLRASISSGQSDLGAPSEDRNPVLGSSSRPIKGQGLTIPITKRALGGRSYLALTYSVTGVVAQIMNVAPFAPVLKLRLTHRVGPPPARPTTQVPPSTTHPPRTTTTTRVPPSTTHPPSTTTTTRVRPAGLVVDAIGDAGPTRPTGTPRWRQACGETNRRHSFGLAMSVTPGLSLSGTCTT